MRLVKSYRPIHCCLWDRECWHDHRAYGMPMRLHLNCLERADGRPIFFTLIKGRDFFGPDSNRATPSGPARDA